MSIDTYDILIYGPLVIAVIITIFAYIQFYRNDRGIYCLPFTFFLFVFSYMLYKFTPLSEGSGWVLGPEIGFYSFILPGHFIFGSLAVLFYYKFIKEDNVSKDD
jgi:hypothetical protein